MSSANSSEADLINTLSFVSAQLNRYLSIFILLFGVVGNLLNCLALSQRTLRVNPCASLFLASSIASLLTLLSGVTVRFLAGWGADLTETVGWICKLRIFVVYAGRTVASWLIVMATIDRWLSSSAHAHRRQMSTLENAQRAMVVISLVSTLVFSQLFYCVDANRINGPVKCSAITNLCQLVNDMALVFLIVLIPSMVMLFFGLLTITNIRRSQLNRVQPSVPVSSSTTNNTKNQIQQTRKADRQLLKMLFIQVILLTLFPLPQVIHNIYSNITRGQLRSPLHNTISSFSLNLFFLLTYVTNGMPFYIYTLTGGSVFRRALFDGIRVFSRKLFCRRG